MIVISWTLLYVHWGLRHVLFHESNFCHHPGWLQWPWGGFHEHCSFPEPWVPQFQTPAFFTPSSDHPHGCAPDYGTWNHSLSEIFIYKKPSPISLFALKLPSFYYICPETLPWQLGLHPSHSLSLLVSLLPHWAWSPDQCLELQTQWHTQSHSSWGPAYKLPT